jgi:hypothetical protein
VRFGHDLTFGDDDRTTIFKIIFILLEIEYCGQQPEQGENLNKRHHGAPRRNTDPSRGRQIIWQ